MMEGSKFYSRGKLIITSEYLVLDGALSLSCPLKKGQWLFVEKKPKQKIIDWYSLDENNKRWFYAKIDKKSLSIIKYSNKQNAQRLQNILDNIKIIKKDFQDFIKDVAIIHNRLEFNKKWGFGSSSTLINNLSQWLDIDPYRLQKLTFKGSGYDIACASSSDHILFRKDKNDRHIIRKVYFHPPFKSKIFFVYLNKKVSSLKSIINYNKIKLKTKNIDIYVDEISQITKDILECKDIKKFEALIQRHENIISNLTKKSKVKDKLFHDYKGGVIKSLGGWGGDFIMATGDENDKDYFIKKGYDKLFNFDEIII